ncbi:Bifunctional transcriptional activator/DNA repair enzyme Ada [Pseudooceanicola marinus]|uniref:methylated-DNA--[protein]-cysteine S-methyltransferase n=1 Tax=Pseudooceanicola marinus TaxID=396013 RepID=A0A1X6ZPR9_9RHOB|nr:trifunctional transcriptional activator/DNA repair protein Ada/methylated-DNA--[protein]-cysteine S-methyltransferase [Pseudooceanicola marinus]PJE26754.1 bifunctional transcriptional activator/DNA repair enzyme protein Ada [Pseudooceanicola marinus]SLN57518.1 Bifunctional transcriptional activator/DNA repair enzyme Ada [Pseudooceanicola marinus]
MMFELPSDDTLYDALLARDASYEGRAWVCVTSTGIFCRLTCPARKPRRENCLFRAQLADCIAEGFRPCKRCHPLRAAGEGDPAVLALLAALDARPDHRWSEACVIALGHDPSTVRRAFKRAFGMTFLDMARQRRLRDGFLTLARGGKVIEAQLEAGFDSPSAFRAAFARHLGVAPGHLKRDALLRAEWIPTPLGDMVAVTCARHLHLLEFADRRALGAEVRRLANYARGSLGLGTHDPGAQIREELARYFAGGGARFDTPLALHGSAFTRQVWEELRRIPAGETRSYADLARTIGRPEAHRAVARANGANQIALVIPCHRVIGSDGSLTGYGGGLWRKQRLLQIETTQHPAQAG